MDRTQTLHEFERFLWLIRHAKAKSQVHRRDYERELSNRGRRECREMSEILASHSYRPTTCIASAAKRTSQTASLLFEDSSTEIKFSDELYVANSQQVIELASQFGDEDYSVAVVGHNPTISACVNLLADGENLGYLPTLGMACVGVPGSWKILEALENELLAIYTPRASVDG